jgi:hypothetical protein
VSRSRHQCTIPREKLLVLDKPAYRRSEIVQGLRRGGLDQTPESACRVHRFSAIGSHFSFQFDDAKVPPNLLLLHSPSLRLTIHIPSHSERAERVSRLPLMCPVLACVTMP